MTRDFGLDRDRLLVTVHQTDEEAAELWHRIAGLPHDRIIRIDIDDNWWRMGDTGPNGPCTEIFYDHGPEIWGGPPGSAEEDGDRFIEIWNLVFMQFETFPDGTSKPLPAPSVDTGMGLERIGALLQGKHDNYDTDLMRALIEASANVTDGAPDGEGRIHHRVIADHLRATSFLIADGVLPSNEGRGYVLRRIMRRAMRHAHLLGAKDPVMYRLVPALVAQMGQAFPELGRAQPLITETLEMEETRFRTTLDRGLRLLDAELEDLPEGTALPGETAFRLYDTFGFPLDLTQDALREKGRTVDTDGFDKAMAAQKAAARAAWKGSGEAADETIWFDIAEQVGATEFLGYDTESAEGQIVAIVRDGARTDALAEGETGWVVVNQTPFYAESGGQVGDSGTITCDDGAASVTDVQKKQGLFAHQAKVTVGTLKTGAAAALQVDTGRRGMIRANHSATHLLHEALRGHLGDHVAQRGSLVAPDRLRFDFTHQKGMSLEEIQEVEREVNGYIRQNAEVSTRLMTPDEAQKMGARASLWREVRRRGPRRLDGRPARGRDRSCRPDLFAGALRRHPCPAHRRDRPDGRDRRERVVRGDSPGRGADRGRGLRLPDRTGPPSGRGGGAAEGPARGSGRPRPRADGRAPQDGGRDRGVAQAGRTGRRRQVRGRGCPRRQRHEVPGPGPARDQPEGPARTDRRAQVAAGIGCRPADRRYGRQGGRRRRRDRRPDRKGLGRRPGACRGREARRQGRRGPAGHGPGRRSEPRRRRGRGGRGRGADLCLRRKAAFRGAPDGRIFAIRFIGIVQTRSEPMKKIIAGTVAVVALAVAIPLTVASADGHRGHGGGHHGERGHMMHGQHGGGGHHGRGHRRGGKKAQIRLMKALERFDANGDGSISQEEVDQYRADRLKQFDADGDGMLTLEEYEALWMDVMRKRMVRRFQRHDSDGDGKITAEEFAERTKHMVMMRDRNDDGVLNKDDLRRGRMGRGQGRPQGMDDDRQNDDVERSE